MSEEVLDNIDDLIPEEEEYIEPMANCVACGQLNSALDSRCSNCNTRAWPTNRLIKASKYADVSSHELNWWHYVLLALCFMPFVAFIIAPIFFYIKNRAAFWRAVIIGSAMLFVFTSLAVVFEELIAQGELLNELMRVLEEIERMGRIAGE
ncbi:MAG: hypothetical protein FWD89_05095 [Firmicutes bacterium]|nr:hypothetical protein [Bacillota bacterium]